MMMAILIVVDALETVFKGREMEEIKIKGRIETSSVEICQNTEKNPGDRKRLAVAQTKMNDH